MYLPIANASLFSKYRGKASKVLICINEELQPYNILYVANMRSSLCINEVRINDEAIRIDPIHVTERVPHLFTQCVASGAVNPIKAIVREPTQATSKGKYW